MRLLNNGKLPCGCDARREIMFTNSDLGIPEAAIVAAAALMLGAAIIYRRTK